jgi:predicted transcriptional regulator
MTTRVITAHVPLDLAKKVDAFAERLERPRGWVMKQALTAWIDREEERDRLTREGLAAVDAGDVVSDELVSRWIDDLEAGRPTKPPL